MSIDMDVHRVTEALDQLLVALLAHEQTHLPAYEAERRRSGLADALRAQDDHQSYILWLAADPVGGSVRKAIEYIGQALHEAGGVALMQRVAEDAARRDSNHYGFRIAVIDKNWDGIGEWLA